MSTNTSQDGTGNTGGDANGQASDPTVAITDEVFDSIPESPPAGVRETEYLYGQLYTAYQQVQYGAPAEYTAYLTPDAASEIIGTPETLVTVDIDVDATNRSASYHGVSVSTYESSDIDKIAHAKYDAGNGLDHSITHETGGGASPGKNAKYALQRLSEWPGKEAVKEVGESHADGWIISALRRLGENEDIIESVRDDVKQALSGGQKRLVTVRLRGVDGGDEWKYPGEVPVLMDAMVARSERKLASKNEADDAVGEGTCFITGEEGTVYGAAPDPLNWYLTKQQEAFDELDSDTAWQTHPVSGAAAITAANSEPLLEACRYSTGGASFYVLPYFTGEQTREKVEALYSLLIQQLQSGSGGDSDDGSNRPVHIEDVYRELPEEQLAELRMHVLGMERYQDKKYRLVTTVFGSDVLQPVELAEAHHDVLQGVRETDWLPWVTEDNDILNSEASGASQFIRFVASPWYFQRSMGEPEGDRDVAFDAGFFTANQRVLSGDAIDAELLFEEYEDRIKQRWAPDGDSDGVPAWSVSLQYAQLAALSRTGLLTSDDPYMDGVTDLYDGPSVAESGNMDTETMTGNSTQADAGESPATTETEGEQSTEETGDGVSRSEIRAARYREYIESHGMLRENPERRAAFLFGALVGEVSRYQKRDGTNPLSKRMTADSITKRNFMQKMGEVLELVTVYSETSDVAVNGTMYSSLTDRLSDDVHEVPPEDWSLSLADLRTHYAFGVTYGLNNYISMSNDGSDETTADKSGEGS